MQKVIASRDVDIYITFDAIKVQHKLVTGSSFSANISGNTEDIMAISTDEPIAVDNSNTSYDINLTLQQAEAADLKDALAQATVGSENGAIAHIRQVIEGASISVHWHKKRDVPATTIVETYSNLTGVSERDDVERAGSETLKNWNFRARGFSRKKIAFTV